MARRPEPPPTVALVAGGIGVLVVLAFVAGVAAGGRTREAPGDRVAVTAAADGAGVAVLAGRCADQRVVSVSLAAPGGPLLWRATSVKGSIARRWVVGGPVPVGAVVVVPLAGALPSRVRAEVVLRRPDHADVVDDRLVDLAGLPPAPDVEGVAPPCGRSVDVGATTLLFAAGAAVVVVGYAGLVVRWARARAGR